MFRTLGLITLAVYSQAGMLVMEEMPEAVPMAGDFANQVIYPRQTKMVVGDVIGCYRHNCH